MPKGQIKDEKTYRKLRSSGESKEKSARIANASAGSSRRKVAQKGGRSSSYTDMSKEDLLKRARKVGIKGRSSMNKEQLVERPAQSLIPAGSARCPDQARGPGPCVGTHHRKTRSAQSGSKATRPHRHAGTTTGSTDAAVIKPLR